MRSHLSQRPLSISPRLSQHRGHFSCSRHSIRISVSFLGASSITTFDTTRYSDHFSSEISVCSRSGARKTAASMEEPIFFSLRASSSLMFTRSLSSQMWENFFREPCFPSARSPARFLQKRSFRLSPCPSVDIPPPS